MEKITSYVKGFVKRRGTRISPFAILYDVKYDVTTSIKALAKLKRAKVSKCTYIGTLTAAYDCSIGKFSSIARECYMGVQIILLNG